MEKAQPLVQGIAPDENNRQWQLRLPSRLTFRPSCCPSPLQRPSPSRGHLPFLLGFLNSFPLSGHPLCDPGSNVGKSLCAHLSFLGFLCRCSICRRPFDFRPSCLLSCSHLGPGSCTELVLPGCFGCSSFFRTRTTEDFSQFILQGINSFFDVGCFTKLLWCCVNHSAENLQKCGVEVKPKEH